jgi:3D (Asp-Asp-Asp) domain-containing protein
MINAKIVAHVLLATVALGAAHHKATSGTHSTALLTFLSAEGSQRFTIRTAKRKRVIRPLTYTVTATAYQAVAGQTDDEPFVTADNSRIKPHYSSKTRWMALSNDLLARWGGKFGYGDKVLVQGISPQLDGVYTVHDTMNKRHRHCIDILTNPKEKFDIFTPDVKIQLVLAAVHPAPTPPLTALAQPAARSRLRTQAAIAKARPARRTPPAGPYPQFIRRPKKEIYFASAIL